MSTLRFSAAFLAGFLAMEALVFSAGFWAARATPSGYFEYFGKERQELALALWSTAAFAVPQFIVGAFLAWLAAVLLKFKSPVLLAAIAAGVVACFGMYLYVAAIASPVSASLGSSLSQHLTGYFPQAWWQISSGPWAGWLGLAVGLLIARRGSRMQPRHTEA